jgi:hypothetical protein
LNIRQNLGCFSNQKNLEVKLSFCSNLLIVKITISIIMNTVIIILIAFIVTIVIIVIIVAIIEVGYFMLFINFVGFPNSLPLSNLNYLYFKLFTFFFKHLRL